MVARTGLSVSLAIVLWLLPRPVAAEFPPELVLIWDGDLVGVNDLAVDGGGIVYTAEFSNRVQKFTATGQRLGGWSIPGSATTPFQAASIDIDPSGDVFVLDAAGRVCKFDPAGTLLATFVLPGYGPNIWYDPPGMAIDRAGNIFVSDTVSSRIMKLDGSGNLLMTWGSHGSGPGQFSLPLGLAVDAPGNVYVADGDNSRVQKFTTDGSFLQEWGSRGPNIRQFGFVKAIAVDPAGSVYATDGLLMQKFSGDGHFLTAWTFTLASAVTVGSDGEIFIGTTHGAFKDAGRVYRFTPCAGSCGPPPPSPQDPKILLHVIPAPDHNLCSRGVPPTCRDAVVRGDLSGSSGPFYFASLLVARRGLDNVAGIQCGITYENEQPHDSGNGSGIDVFSWHLCATIQFPAPEPNAWPDPGGGNLIVWDSTTRCQTEELAIAGYFYIAAYSRDRLRVIPRQIDSQAKVSNCAAIETVLHPGNLGWVSFSGGRVEPGCNPCEQTDCLSFPVTAVSTTWGALKALFRNP